LQQRYVYRDVLQGLGFFNGKDKGFDQIITMKAEDQKNSFFLPENIFTPPFGNISPPP
jgi:hypothetical protein